MKPVEDSTVRFVSLRFVSLRFVSLRFVSLRFVSLPGADERPVRGNDGVQVRESINAAQAGKVREITGHHTSFRTDDLDIGSLMPKNTPFGLLDTLGWLREQMRETQACDV